MTCVYEKKHPNIVTLFIKKSEWDYATTDILTVTHGLVNEYLRMTFDVYMGQVR